MWLYEVCLWPVLQPVITLIVSCPRAVRWHGTLVTQMSDHYWICLQNRPGHARQSGDRSCRCSRVTLLELQDAEEESDGECFEPQPLLCLCSGQRDWRLSSLHQESAFLKLCCLLQRGTFAAWSSVFFHMLSETFLIFFIYCRYIMSNLAYCRSLVTVVSTRYLRHSVTNGWCMFCFITFKYIYLYSKGDKGEKLIYFYGCSDFKLHFRSLTHWVAFDRTSFDATFFTVSLLTFSVKILPG